MIWEKLDMVRVYTKPKGTLPDYNEPVVLPRAHSSVENFCNKVGLAANRPTHQSSELTTPYRRGIAST